MYIENYHSLNNNYGAIKKKSKISQFQKHFASEQIIVEQNLIKIKNETRMIYDVQNYTIAHKISLISQSSISFRFHSHVSFN